MGLLKDVMGVASGSPTSNGGAFSQLSAAYQRRKKKRNDAKMDKSIATSEEDSGRGGKRSGSKRSDDWS